jgi:uncharacterized membrane protein
MAGLFFVFSVVVMPALDRVPATSAIATMQAVNRVIVNPLFLLVFLGTGLGLAALSVVAVVGETFSGPARLAVLAATATYLVGVFAVTGGANVPRNDALDLLDPAALHAAADWAAYAGPWTAWNHVRTVASIATTALLVAVA